MSHGDAVNDDEVDDKARSGTVDATANNEKSLEAAIAASDCKQLKATNLRKSLSKIKQTIH